jgi:hypothetical protein
MKTLARRVKEAFAVMVLLAACIVSAGQLSAEAQVAPGTGPGGGDGCAGLTCVDKSDCGSACFCNRPSQTCYKDGEVLE